MPRTPKASQGWWCGYPNNGHEALASVDFTGIATPPTLGNFAAERMNHTYKINTNHTTKQDNDENQEPIGNENTPTRASSAQKPRNRKPWFGPTGDIARREFANGLVSNVVSALVLP